MYLVAVLVLGNCISQPPDYTGNPNGEDCICGILEQMSSHGPENVPVCLCEKLGNRGLLALGTRSVSTASGQWLPRGNRPRVEDMSKTWKGQ